MQRNITIAETMAAVDATGLLAEFAALKGGGLAPAEAREALECLIESIPSAAASVRATFLAWPPERQAVAADALAGDDAEARRTWTRLLCGIIERPDGTTALA